MNGPLNLPLYRGSLDVSQMCQGRLACGVPTVGIRNINTAGCVWIPSEPPVHHTNTTVHLVSLERITERQVNVTVSVRGPSRVMLLLSTRGNVSIGKSLWIMSWPSTLKAFFCSEQWSLSSRVVTKLGWGPQPVYQIQRVTGLSAAGDTLLANIQLTFS